MNLPKNQYRISITTSCNMKCTYCHNEGNSKCSKLSIEQIRKLIDYSQKFNLKEVRLTGGDPLTHPQIYDICEMIKKDYHLLVGINTNCVEINKLMNLVQNNFIDRIVVGLDYFDNEISKDSPIGVSSKQILKNIELLSDYVSDISIDIVFNNNLSDIEKIISWGLSHNIRVKVIEIEKNEICSHSDIKYLEMTEYILNKFKLDRVIDEIEEMNGYKNGKKVVSFLHSLCRLRRCDICKKIQLRITSDGTLKPCIHYSDQDVPLFDGDIEKNIEKTLSRKVNYHYDKSLKVD